METIRTPGKFEGEPIYVPYLWDIVLDGVETITDVNGNEYSIVGIDPEDVQEFPMLSNVDAVILWTDENGFVHSREMTHMECDNFRKEVES